MQLRPSRRGVLRGAIGLTGLGGLVGVHGLASAWVPGGRSPPDPPPDLLTDPWGSPPPDAPSVPFFGGPPAPSPEQPRTTIDLPQLSYAGTWNPRPGVMRELAREVRLRTRLEPVEEPSSVRAEATELYDTPFLYVAGVGGLPPLGAAAEAQLRRFVDLGGLLVFDDADGGLAPGFLRDVKALLSRVLPSSDLTRVGHDHVLYRSFYIIDSPVGRTDHFDHVLGVQEEGRVKVLCLQDDLGGALSRSVAGLYSYPCTPGGQSQREWAIRFGVNIVLYATCTDYKADPAHVETLLRGRRWR